MSQSIDGALVLLRGGDPNAALARLLAAPQGKDTSAYHCAMGMVHLASGCWSKARVALRLAVSMGDRSPTTLLNLALAEDRSGDSLCGRALMRHLQDISPAWDEPGLRLAESFRREGRLHEAVSEYRDTLSRNPSRVDALIGLAAVLMTGHSGLSSTEGAAQAQMLLLQSCGLAPFRPDAWDALGVSLMMTRDFGKAEAAFAQAQARAPHDAEIALRRVEASFASGSAIPELARLELASLDDPMNVALLAARGAMLGQLGRHDEAAEILGVAIILAPDSSIAARALAHALVAGNKVREALPALQHAINLAPDDVGLRNNHAATLVRAHRYREAAIELHDLIEKHGEQPGFLCNLTNALVSIGQHDAAMCAARRAVEMDPSGHMAWRTMSNVLSYHPEVTADALLDSARRAGAALVREPAIDFASSRDPSRRLRVGLLSLTLKKHPVGWLTIAGFENLDRSKFDLVCLGQGQSDDVIQRRFRSAAGEWHVVEGLDTNVMVKKIRSLDLDILIDLGGYGDRGLMSRCADRLAPLQVKWVGAQSHSSGLAEIDWFLTDRWETPAGFERFYSERLLRLPNGYVCYSPPAYAPDVAPLPATANGFVTFGCFNNLAKITPKVISTWCQILTSIPASRLVLKAHQLADPETADEIRSGFRAGGVNAERVALRGGSSHRELLEQYSDIDIVLDPFPYSGGLTTCEALWMGVPTLTVPGETFASRHSTSHMSNVGLESWVAADIIDYCRKAQLFANNIGDLVGTRAGLRARVKASPLCNATLFGADLGSALRQAWKDWCEGISA